MNFKHFEDQKETRNSYWNKLIFLDNIEDCLGLP